MKKRKVIATIIGILVILAAATGSVVDFLLQSRQISKDETYRTLTEMSEHYNKAFLDRINSHLKTLNVVAGMFEALPQSTQENITLILQNAMAHSGFTRIVVTDATGMSFSNDKKVVDVSHRDYYQKAMQGGTVVSGPLTSIVDKVGSLVLAVPIHQGGDTIGVLCGMYSLAMAGEQLLDSSYYSGGYGFIISKNGDIILSSDHGDKLCHEENLLQFFDQTAFTDYSPSDLQNAMANGESGTFALVYQGERRFASFMPSGINDWYTFSLASDALIRQQEATTNQQVLVLTLKLAVIAAFLVALIVLSKRQHNREMRMANVRYQSLIDNINGGVVVMAHSNEAQQIITTYVSNGFSEMTGYSLADILTLYNGMYILLLHPEDRQQAFNRHIEQSSAGNVYRMSYRIIKKDGAIIWVLDTGYVVTDKQGNRLNHSILTDITVIKQQEEALRFNDERFRIAIKASHATLFEIDLQTKTFLYFENTEALLGLSLKQLLEDTKSFSEMSLDEYEIAVKSVFFHQDDTDLLNIAFEAVFSGHPTSFEARMKRTDGSYVWCKIDMGIITSEDGLPMRAVGYVTDISDIKSNTEYLENQAQLDPLTGLYNKTATALLTNKVFSAEANALHALIILDIDNFKGVNDTLGHAFGDAVLMDVCAKLKALFRSDDIVGRIGGDEFAVLMHNVPNTNLVLQKAAEIGGTFRRTYAGEKGDYKISCSMGIVLFENQKDRFETLSLKADAALYQAKRSGKDGFVLYREEDAKDYHVAGAKTNDAEPQGLKVNWNIEERIFELLYDSRDFSESVNMALAMIGQLYHVSRAYVFENDASGTYTSNTYEWCSPGIVGKLDQLQNVELSAGTDSVLACYDENGLFYCNDVRILPDEPRQMLERQGILSTLQTAMVNDGKIGGFIGFDEYSVYRVWTASEIDTLSFLAKILSIFLFKNKAESSLTETLNSRLLILDSLPDYICVINPENHSIEYANSKMQELLPVVTNGAFCYTTLRGGQDGPCSECLVDRIKRGDTDNLEIISENKNVRLKVNALYINWSERKKMVLLYGKEQ